MKNLVVREYSVDLIEIFNPKIKKIKNFCAVCHLYHLFFYLFMTECHLYHLFKFAQKNNLLEREEK